MAMELKMVNPDFESCTFSDGTHWYSLVFDGWDGIKSIDEDGDEFFYEVVCEDIVWNRADAFASFGKFLYIISSMRTSVIRKLRL